MNGFTTNMSESFWEIDINNNFSGTFKFMLILRHKAFALIERRIFDKKSTNYGLIQVE